MPIHDCRCLGVYSSELGNTRCPKRDTCIRYTQRTQTGTPIAAWLCPTLDSYYGMYIEEVKA